ncbi:MAG: GDP-L-fucose synthase [Desulfobacterales bacterium]|nr:GDP-L-fucose synthase [Desulfobacterales bacterium]
MDKYSKIYVAGHTGLVGTAILRRLKADKYRNLIFRSHAELDLTRQTAVEDFFQTEKPEYVFLAAAKVGGILANSTYPADFIYDNLVIQTNVIHAARKSGVKRLLFLGSSCIYPRECPQPMKEEYLLTGPLEKTNEPYAIAKIAGIKMCQSYNRQHGTRFLAVMPTNLYGPNDSFDLETSHVLPALIRKFHLAKLAAAGDWQSIDRDEKKYGAIPDDFRFSLISISRSAGHAVSVPTNTSLPAPSVPIWGSGTPRREFLHVDDLADACLFLINTPHPVFHSLIVDSQVPLINIGCSQDHTIRELAGLVNAVVGFQGEIIFDPSKPDGTPRKLLDTSNIAGMGWEPTLSFQQGIRETYQWYLNP